MIAYVDGSYSAKKSQASYGLVVPLAGGNYMEADVLPQADSGMHNVSGEITGALCAVRYALEHGYTEVELHYDYEGIAKWVTGEWKAKKPLVKKYAEVMRMCGLKITFVKEDAHTGVELNELADSLAKSALIHSSRFVKEKV